MLQQRGPERGAALQDPFLNILRKERIPVSIFLVNGIRLQGHIESFDQFVVLLRNSVNQMIYKHAISTIVPARAVRTPHVGGGGGGGGGNGDFGNERRGNEFPPDTDEQPPY